MMFSHLNDLVQPWTCKILEALFPFIKITELIKVFSSNINNIKIGNITEYSGRKSYF